MATHSQALSALVDGILRGGIRVVDLTVPLEAATQTIRLPEQFAPSKPFALDEISRYDSRGPAWYWNNISCGEHTATHNIPVERFIGPACVIDVSPQVRGSADFLLTQGIVEQWESHHGRIPSRAWVLIRTDWSKRPGESFLNFSSDGSHTPGFHPECVPFLARERDILGVGVETVGTDAGQAHTFNPMFPCHTIMHGANRFGLASLTNLDQLPPTGAVVIAPPLKIVNGSGSPLRVLALVPV